MTNEEVLRTLAHLVGTPYAPALKDTIRTLTGRTRVVGPNEMCTREYDVERIQIKAGADLLIRASTSTDPATAKKTRLLSDAGFSGRRSIT